LSLESRVRGIWGQTGDRTSGTPTEDSASGPVKMGVMVKKPGVAENHRELWRLYQMKIELLLVLTDREVERNGKKGYLPWTQRSSISAVTVRGVSSESEGIWRLLARDKSIKFPAAPESTKALS